jgi:hypothetical protein
LIQIKTFCFRSDHKRTKSKHFGFVPIISFDIETFVRSFRYRWYYTNGSALDSRIAIIRPSSPEVHLEIRAESHRCLLWKIKGCVVTGGDILWGGGEEGRGRQIHITYVNLKTKTHIGESIRLPCVTLLFKVFGFK